MQRVTYSSSAPPDDDDDDGDGDEEDGDGDCEGDGEGEGKGSGTGVCDMAVGAEGHGRRVAASRRLSVNHGEAASHARFHARG